MSILSGLRYAPSNNSYYDISKMHLPRQTAPIPKESGWLILLSSPSHRPKKGKGD
jgi:hypothetical protein